MTPEFRHLEIADTDAVVTLLQKVLPDDQPHNEPATALKLTMQTDKLSFVASVDGAICGLVMAGFDGHRSG